MSKHQICRNCGHNADGNYCPACGQRTTTGRLTWPSLVESVSSTFIGDEAYGLRGINMRKGAVMTWLAILCQPYKSISEYLEGHRRKYFNPVAILLMLSTFYAIVFSLVGKEFTPTAKEGQHMFLWLICSYYDYAKLHPAANMLLALPFLALAMKTVFRKKSDLKYVEYLYIGIFLSLFEITLMIAGLPAELLFSWYSAFYIQTLPVFIYTAFVCWRLFKLSKKGAVLRTLLVNLLQYVYIFVASLLLLITALGGYALTAPEKFKKEFNIGAKGPKGERAAENREDTGLLEDILDGIIDGLSGDGETAGTGAGEAADGNEADTRDAGAEAVPAKSMEKEPDKARANDSAGQKSDAPEKVSAENQNRQDK